MATGNMKRLALIGFGNIARKHLEVFRALGAEVVAACNRSEANRSLAQNEGSIPRCYNSISKMLESEHPDGVLCCASYGTIFEAASEALPFGIPTLLEKPPGLSRQQALTLHEIAQTHRTQVMVGVNRRHYSVIQRALEDAGGLHSVTAVMVDWSEQPGFFLKRGDSPSSVEGLVFANSLHALDTMTYLSGPIPEARVCGVNREQPFSWQMAFQGISQRGVLASFTSTWDSPCRWRISFCSPGRRYVFAPLETCRVFEDGSPEVREITPSNDDARFKPGFMAQAREFLRILDGEEPHEDYSISSVLPAMDLAEKLTQACLGTSQSGGPGGEESVSEMNQKNGGSDR